MSNNLLVEVWAGRRLYRYTKFEFTERMIRDTGFPNDRSRSAPPRFSAATTGLKARFRAISNGGEERGRRPLSTGEDVDGFAPLRLSEWMASSRLCETFASLREAASVLVSRKDAKVSQRRRDAKAPGRRGEGSPIRLRPTSRSGVHIASVIDGGQARGGGFHMDGGLRPTSRRGSRPTSSPTRRAA
jgi:hypothetical protein